MKAPVFDIARTSVVDGPGIRTTVFLKGCNLRCAWCHNPESFEMQPQRATLPNGQEKTWGTPMSVVQVMKIVRQDRPFYANSGGGVTISGGEPLLHADFVVELLRRCREEDIHTAIETNGAVAEEILRAALPHTDLFLFDYKLSDPEAARKWTGQALDNVRTNLDLLLDCGADVILRCPIIQGINDTDEHFEQIAELSRRDGIRETHLMPFHNTARDKWTALGLDYSFAENSSMTDDEIRATQTRILVLGGRDIVV